MAMWLREELQWKKNSVYYTWSVNKAALGSCLLPLIVFQWVWVHRSIGAPVKGGWTLPCCLSTQTATGAASQAFLLFSQLLTKAHWKMGCSCFHCKEIHHIDFNKAGTRDSFFPDPSPRNPLPPEESLPVHVWCLQVKQDFAWLA